MRATIAGLRRRAGVAGRTGDAELMADRTNGSAPIVVVREVHKSFGDVHALVGVSLEIKRGTVLGSAGAQRRWQDDAGAGADDFAGSGRGVGDGGGVSTCGANGRGCVR